LLRLAHEGAHLAASDTDFEHHQRPAQPLGLLLEQLTDEP